MNDFAAKLYHVPSIGQVLVTMDSGVEGPELRISFSPNGLGVCSTTVSFEDSDEGWDNLESAFDIMDEATALTIVEDVMDKLGLDETVDDDV